MTYGGGREGSEIINRSICTHFFMLKIHPSAIPCRDMIVCVDIKAQFCLLIRSEMVVNISFVATKSFSKVYPNFISKSDSSNANDARKMELYARKAASKCTIWAGPSRSRGKSAKHRRDCFTISLPTVKANRRSST